MRMRIRSTLRTQFAKLPCCLLVVSMLGGLAASGSETPLAASGELSTENVDRARMDLARIQTLVGLGELPKSSLDEAEARLADIKDEAVLKETLFGSIQPSELTADQQARMLAAAQGRVDHQAALARDRQKLLAIGVISRAEMAVVNQELDLRQHVLNLVQERLRVAAAQHQPAIAEPGLESEFGEGIGHKVMVKFEGNGHFDKGDLALIASEFELHFNYPLPITARGQTSLHQSLGFDHRGKIDVGLNPEKLEGIWLRHFLEDRQIPYIAFRSALKGSATAPHIHLGTGSSRIGSEVMQNATLQKSGKAPVAPSRGNVMALARDRVRLVEMRRMAKGAQNLAPAVEPGKPHPALLKVVEENGSFDKATFALINAGFARQFHHPLPVVANGQTAFHDSLGLDHRGKMDVGVNPAQPEGIWLRQFLVSHRIPYLAETRAEHIHIGASCAKIASQKPVEGLRFAVVSHQVMANEENMERSKAMLRFDGSGHFDTSDFAVIATEFEQRFHTALPVAARGQTALHQSLGLDHHGKIDVALNPEEPEGIWLRHVLEDRQIPYLAFRTAVAGSAKAPYIHIGAGTTRLVHLALR